MNNPQPTIQESAKTYTVRGGTATYSDVRRRGFTAQVSVPQGLFRPNRVAFVPAAATLTDRLAVTRELERKVRDASWGGGK